MSQVTLRSSIKEDLREEVAELERMIVSAGHVTTGLETVLDKENGRFAEGIRNELQSIWEILVDAEMALLRVQTKYVQSDRR